MKRLLWGLVFIGALAAAAPYLPAGILRGRVAAALERSLDRPVEIGDIRFTFFPAGPVPGPGFVLENVTIHEDPRAGIEPFAHMTELGASIRLLSLLRGKFELSGISLGEASINVVKTAGGMWNFQFLLENPEKRESPLPAVRMRAGRVNFKFGDMKSAFYFNDADLDISPGSGGIDLGFGGAPSRTDKSTQDFGRFFIRGTASNQKLDFRVDFERSSLEETLRLIDPRGFGVHGVVALDARISGAPSALNVTGNVQVGDIHRWDLLPAEGDALKLAFTGTLDLRAERLELATALPQPVTVQFKARDLLKTPEWEASASFDGIPLATLFEVGRHMGAQLPENLAVDGSVSGTARYDQRGGLSGQLMLGEASLTLPEQDPVKASEAHLSVIGGSVRLSPAEVRIGEQTAQIDGIVTLAEPHAIDLTIRTRALSVAAMQSFGLAAIPIIGQTQQGTWRGWARYRDDAWSGESELRNARIEVDGLADPIEIETAAVTLRGRRVALDKLKAKAGATAFQGSYTFDPSAKYPHKFNLVLDEADSAELERLFAPALAHGQRGFLARTLRLGSAPPPPPWLKARRAEGSVRIGSLATGPWKAAALKAALVWDGTDVTLDGVGNNLAGQLTIDLSGADPKYRANGTLGAVPYRDGVLQVIGSVTAEGSGARVLESVQGEASVKGITNAPVPEEDFRVGAIQFQLQTAGVDPRWKLMIGK